MKLAAGIVTSIVCAACVASVCAQEPAQPARPNILLQMSRPSEAMPIGGNRRDDILDRPTPPRSEPSQESFRLYVGVGDARCYPGEDALGLDRYPLGSRRRR